MSDLIDRQQAIDVLKNRWLKTRNYEGIGEDIAEECEIYLRTVPSIQFATDTNVGTKLGTNLAQVGTDCISRQAAISAICNACGKIDCDKMDKCEKLQLPPANCSEFPNNSDTISRQAAIDAIDEISREVDDGDGFDYAKWREYFCELPSAELKRGKWIQDRSGAYCCSECMEPCAGYVMMKPRDKFCKMCGSRNEVTK